MAQSAAHIELDQFLVKCENDEIDDNGAKYEPILDVLGEAINCDMSEFVDTYNIKVEESLNSNDTIDANDPYIEGPEINSNDGKSSHIKVEAIRSEPNAAPIIDNELLSIAETENEKPVLPAENAIIAKLSFCRICNRQYANPSVCATHMREIHKIKQPDIPRPHKCLLCEKSYGRSSHLWRHYEKRHDSTPDRKMKKEITKMRKQNVTVEMLHESTETPHETVSNSVQVDEAQLNVAPETVSKQNTEIEPFGVAADRKKIAQLSYCHICNRKYANQGSCSIHMLEVHQIKLPEIQRSYKCLQCDKSYTRSNHLTRHYASAHGETARNMKIQTIANTSVQKKMIQKGVETDCDQIAAVKTVELENGADGEAATYCEICDKNYSTRANLTMHMWSVHRTSLLGRPHECAIETCRKSYESRKSLLQHYREKHDGNPELRMRQSRGKVKPEEDPITGTKIESGSIEGKAAIPDAERPHSCDVCHKSYITRGHLTRHLKGTHGIGGKRTANEPNGFECYICHESFKLSELLKKHTIKLHLPVERSSICPTCGLSTPRLGRHIILAHSVIKSQCHICQRVYNHPSRLSTHMKTHTLPAQCDLCPKRFSSNGAMRQHRRYHTMEKPYECKYCGVRFIERSTCTQHERTHTGEKP